MEYNGYINGNKVIHCPTRALADQVVAIAHKLGFKWKFSSDELTHWDNYKENTCYILGAYNNNCLTYGYYKESTYENFIKVRQKNL